MGKLLSSDASPDKVASAKCNVSTTTAIKYPGGANVLIYMLCVTSLGFSVYTSLCHSQLENRIRNFHRLDERISTLEAKLRIFPIQFLQSLATLPSAASASLPADNGTLSADAAAAATATVPSTLNDDDVIADGNFASADEFANIVRKLSVQISGIQRLRRDVTYLKASRRGERQASVQQTSECMCPPGKLIWKIIKIISLPTLQCANDCKRQMQKKESDLNAMWKIYVCRRRPPMWKFIVCGSYSTTKSDRLAGRPAIVLLLSGQTTHMRSVWQIQFTDRQSLESCDKAPNKLSSLRCLDSSPTAIRMHPNIERFLKVHIFHF